jgi:hypothetical protein
LIREEWSGPPLLVFWANRRNSGFQFDEGRRLLGASLVAVPLVLERPSAGTQVRIPAPFLPYRTTFQPDGAWSSLWDHRHQEWQERNRPASTWLRIQLPAELLPIELTLARIIVQVSGPVGRFEISALRHRGEREASEPGKPDVVSVKTWHDPVGTLAVEISDRELLQTSADGGIMLGVAAGDPDRPELTVSQGKANYWKIEHLAIEIDGMVGQ